MKRSVSITAAVAFSLAFGLAACDSGNSPSSNASQSEQTLAWALTYKADCSGAADPTQCIGAYGFTVDADGAYEVGPGPKGQTLKAKLDPEDFDALTQLAGGIVDRSVASNPPGSQESCNGFYGSDADSTLILRKRGANSTVLHKTGTNLCSNRLDQAAAEALHEEIVTLADKYYPAIFPDACLEAAAAVSALYPSVEKCKVNADCGYLDLDFQPIASDTIDQVYVDNCSVVQNLPAANLSALQSHLSQLQAALQNTQQICGTRIVRDGCSGVKNFASSAAAAVCQQGVCRVNPSLGF